MVIRFLCFDFQWAALCINALANKHGNRVIPSSVVVEPWEWAPLEGVFDVPYAARLPLCRYQYALGRAEINSNKLNNSLENNKIIKKTIRLSL